VLAFALLATQLKPLPTMEQLDALVAQYRSLDLPLPPPEAPLVRNAVSAADEMGSRTFGVSYFLKNWKGPGRHSLFTGTHVLPIQCCGDCQIEVPPALTNADKIFAGAWPTPVFYEDEGLAIAVIELTRGHKALALEVLRKAAVEGVEMPPTLYRSKPGANLTTRMRFLAFQHWANELTQPKSDRENIEKHLAILFASNQDVQTRNNQNLCAIFTQRFLGVIMEMTKMKKPLITSATL